MLQPGGRLSLLLLLLCLGAGALLVFEYRRDPVLELSTLSDHGPADAPSEGAGGQLDSRSNPRKMPSLASLSETMERPLFLPSRRPLDPVEEKKLPVTAPRDIAGLAVVGIVIVPEERMAMINHRAQRKTLRVIEGDTVDGWRVEQVLATGVVLSRSDTLTTLVMKDQPRSKNRKPKVAKSPTIATPGQEVQGSDQADESQIDESEATEAPDRAGATRGAVSRSVN